MSIGDIEAMSDEELLDKFVEVVRQNKWQIHHNETDCVLYQMLRGELGNRMELGARRRMR